MTRQISITDIHRKLGLKLRLKQNQLLEILNERYHITNDVLPKVVYKYKILFGKLENELQSANEKLLLYEKIISLLLIKAKRGEKISSVQILKIENDVITESKQKATKPRFDDFQNPDEKIIHYALAKENLPNNKLTKTYRQLAKLLHPDSPDLMNEYSKYWNLVADAYANKDLTRLNIYLNIIQGSYFPELSDDTFAEYKRNISQLMRRIEFEKRKFKRQMLEEPWNFIGKIDNNEWLEKRKEILRTKIANVETESERLKKILWQIKQGEYITLEESEEYKFDSQFSANTYFKNG